MTDTMPSEQTDSGFATLLRPLRKAAKLTQQTLADAAGLTRLEIVNLEGGRNRGTRHRIHTGLAHAFGVTVETLDAYLDGKIDLPDLLERRQPIQDVAA